MLPWQQAKYSSSAPDKGTQDKCDAPHLSNSNSLVLLLSAKICSHFGDYWPIFVDVQAKRLNTAHRVPATSSVAHTYTHKTCKKKATLLELASIFMPPPHPPPPFKENTAEVSECQRARICFTFPKCHGIWAACTNEKQGGVEAGRKRTWVKHRR